MDRQSLLHLLQSRDPHSLITNKQFDSEELPALISEYAFNGSDWECFLCDRVFSASNSLLQHLESRIHQHKGYHCPNTTDCEREFVSLAGVFSHLESESCDYMSFEKVQQVQRQFSGVLTGRKMIVMTCFF